MSGFDPEKMPPDGTPCAVLDSMARELAASAAKLQAILVLVSGGEYMEARDLLWDTHALRPAQQYLLGLEHSRKDEES